MRSSRSRSLGRRVARTEDPGCSHEDAKRKRVIGAALGNNTVEVVDTFSGRDMHGITGAAAPQGVVYVGDLNKLFVANGTDGKLRIYDGDSFKLLNTVDIGEDADNVRYDSAETKDPDDGGSTHGFMV